ncbi:hypothetical protein GNP10_14635 [Escherichia coli]|nr:hypothetical protein [Escherichia coli]
MRSSSAMYTVDRSVCRVTWWSKCADFSRWTLVVDEAYRVLERTVKRMKALQARAGVLLLTATHVAQFVEERSSRLLDPNRSSCAV